MTESATHSPTPWRDALTRLHFRARCDENRWHYTPTQADSDKETILREYDEMVQALKDAERFLVRQRDAIGASVASNLALTKIRSALSKSNPTQKGG